MIKPIGSLNSTFYPTVGRELRQQHTLHPAATSDLIASAADTAQGPKAIHAGAAAIGYPSLGNTDINSVSLLDSLSRVSSQGLSASGAENAVAPLASAAGMYSAFGQLAPLQPAPGSMVDTAV